MKTSLALQRSTVASARDAHCPGCASNVPCLPGTVQGERGGEEGRWWRFAAQPGKECRSRFGHFSCAFQHRGQLRSFQRLCRRHFPPLFSFHPPPSAPPPPPHLFSIPSSPSSSSISSSCIQSAVALHQPQPYTHCRAQSHA